MQEQHFGLQPLEHSNLHLFGGKFRIQRRLRVGNKFELAGYARADGTFTSGDMFDRQGLAQAAQFDTAGDAIAWGEARGWDICVNREKMTKGDAKMLQQTQMKRTGKVSASGRLGSLLFGVVFFLGGVLVTWAALSSQGSISVAAVLAGPIAIIIGVVYLTRGVTGKDKPFEDKPAAPPIDFQVSSATIEERRARIAANQCPKCANPVNPGDMQCPSCRTNLQFAREHLDQW
ncbi:MAG: hypothetical protein M1570_01280 [Chloroflexi bacterium]|nr:hypothetical protein [Chloroflexota bacterium]